MKRINRLFTKHLNYKFIFFFSLVIIALQIANAFILIHTKKKELSEDIRNNAVFFTQLTSEKIVGYYRRYDESGYRQLYSLIADMMGLNKEIQEIYIISTNGNILFHPEELIHQKKEPYRSQKVSAELRARVELAEMTKVPLVINGQPLIDIVCPYFEQWGKHPLSVRYIFNYKTLEVKIAKMQRQILAVSLFSIILGIGLAYFFINRITKPIKSLVDVVRIISRGDLGQEIAVKSSDEIGELTAAFDLMRNNLKESFSTLENKVEMRTKELHIAKEKAEAASRAKSGFLASMSHELRTPLNAILGFSQIMAKDQAATPTQRENLTIILKSGEHLLTLINSVLDLAKIESGKIRIDSEAFDLGSLVSDLILMLKVRAETKGITLCLDQSSSFPRFIRSDPAKLRQILINLIGNAVKFTEQGKVIVKLAVLALNHGTRKLNVAFEIIDTGIGMEQADIERIFHPFEQAKNKNLTEGTGLGLAIAREYITMLGGTISATSTPRKGSTFHFTIVGEEVEAEQIVKIQKAQGEIMAIEKASNCRILVIEDQLENRLFLQQLLIPYGFQYREATNGEEGVAIARQWQPHCILMDRRMPVMDGIEAIHTIRELELDPRPAIIGVTAHAYKEEQDEMIQAGCDDFLGKPFKENALFNSLAKHLPITIFRATTSSDSSASANQSTTADVANLSTALNRLSATILGQLKEAAIRCDVARISDLLDPYPEVKRGLKPLLDSYRFDFLLDEIGALLKVKN